MVKNKFKIIDISNNVESSENLLFKVYDKLREDF